MVKIDKLAMNRKVYLHYKSITRILATQSATEQKSEDETKGQDVANGAFVELSVL